MGIDNFYGLYCKLVRIRLCVVCDSFRSFLLEMVTVVKYLDMDKASIKPGT